MYSEQLRTPVIEESFRKRPPQNTQSEIGRLAQPEFYSAEDLVSTEQARAFPQVDIGLFFGAYDPPHWGHGRTAKHVRETTGMKEVWFVPSAFHRFGKNMTEIEQRVSMLKALRDQIGGLPEYRVAPLESHFNITDGKAHKVLQALNVPVATTGEAIAQSRFGIILGLDNHARFHEWWEAQEILQKVPIFFASRPGNVVPKMMHKNMYLVPDFDGNSSQFNSTAIRQGFRDGKSEAFAPLFPSEVQEIILEQGLYQPTQDSPIKPKEKALSMSQEGSLR